MWGGGGTDYFQVLWQFCSGLDESLRFIREDIEKEQWNDYAIRAHAFKGVLATIGIKPLAEQAYTLEQAAKNGNIELCRNSLSFCEDLAIFRDRLKATELVSGTVLQKTKITADVLQERLHLLEKACAGYRIKQIKEIAMSLQMVSYDAETDNALEEIFHLTNALDYDEAIEKIDALILKL